MQNNVLLFGWNRAIPGREKISGEHFQEFVGYLAGLQKSGAIDSFDTVFLDPSGADMIGFFLIRADSDRLNALTSSEAWNTHLVRAMFHLERPRILGGYTGDAVMERMRMWSENIPG